MQQNLLPRKEENTIWKYILPLKQSKHTSYLIYQFLITDYNKYVDSNPIIIT